MPLLIEVQSRDKRALNDTVRQKMKIKQEQASIGNRGEKSPPLLNWY